MSSAEARTKALQGLKGKLVEVLQSYGDCLCESLLMDATSDGRLTMANRLSVGRGAGSELGGRLVPNEGFLSNAVVPLGRCGGGRCGRARCDVTQSNMSLIPSPLPPHGMQRR